MQANTAEGSPADLLVSLDRTEPRRLRAQLEQILREGIRSGRLAPGVALPPSRTLAVDIDVARSVVVDAYGQLVAEGYLDARQGAGTRVVTHVPAEHGVPTGAGRSRSAGRPLSEQSLSGLPDLALFPRQEWLRHYRTIVSEAPDTAFGYPDPQGEVELRRALNGYLGRVRAVHATPDDLVICSGFTHGLALLCRVLLLKGKTRIAVEDPCFALHRSVILAAGLRPVPVAVDEHGIDVARLSTLSVDGVVLSPAHSYPTGAVLSPERRVELVAWARRAGTLIIEDDFDAEFRYDRTAIGAIQGLAPDHVVYGGSVSKMIGPVLRLGWLAVPSHLVDDVISAKFTHDVTTEGLGQLALARFIESGGLSRHLRRARLVYRKRRDRLIAALARQLPQAAPIGVEAGLHVYLRLPPGTDEGDLVRRAQAEGLLIEGAALHWAERDSAPALLVGYGGLHGDRIEHTAAALAKLMHATEGSNRAGAA